MTEAAAQLTRRAERPSLATLWRVETRKMVDTRAGKWLLGLTVLLAIAGTVLGLIGDDEDVGMALAFLTAGSLASVLLPVVGVLLVTSEWSQRTALLTFVMVPDRNRVAAAKGLAAVSVAVALSLLCLVMALIGAVASGEGADISLVEIGQGVLYQCIVVLIGVALGLALRISPLAIVAYFAAPTFFALFGVIGETVREVTEWLDQSGLVALGELDPTGQEMARVGVTVLVWVVVPAAIGLLRLRNEDVS